MKGRSQFETLSGCRLEGVSFPPALGNWWKTTACRTCLLSLRNKVISNLKDEINPPDLNVQFALLQGSWTCCICFHEDANTCAFQHTSTHVPCLSAREEKQQLYTSAFQLSHPPVECVRWAASWRGVFGSKCGDPFCMWCGGCPHTSQCFSLHFHQKKTNKKTPKHQYLDISTWQMWIIVTKQLRRRAQMSRWHPHVHLHMQTRIL